MRIFAICLLAAACATPTQTRGPIHLAAGAPIAAPEGLADYCVRMPSECNFTPRSDLRGRIEATGAASFQAASYQSQSGRTSVFYAMMTARLAPQEAPGALAPSHLSSGQMTLSDERWQQLRRVNREINRAIRPETDRAVYGVDEYWQRPLVAFGRNARGDCEDYALEKRARLLALGWAPDMLAMAVAVSPQVGLHATLIVQTDRGDFVLDNLHSEPRALTSLDYMWISRQTGSNLTDWAIADVTASPAVLRQAGDVSAEAMFQRLMRQRAGAVALDVNQGLPAPAPTVAQPVEVVAETSRRAPKPGMDRRPALPVFAGGTYARSQTMHVAP